jgi:hypothetical protein
MEKKVWPVLIVFLFVFSLAGAAHSWQGRMAGMGDPFGLVMDESDLLIHPSEIAEGKGINFYGNYRFNWLDVTDWNYTAKYFDSSTGALVARFPFRTNGDDRQHDALVGVAIPLGPGRLGVFFQYAGGYADFQGHELIPGSYNRYSFDDSLNAFNLRVLYGIPMGALKLGSEFQIGYQKAKNTDTFFSNNDQVFLNDIIGAHIPSINTFPFQFPYDSKWWNMGFKSSLEGPLGPGKLSATVRGGFIFSGENDPHYRIISPPSSVFENVNFDGNVEGWNTGGDLWWRTPLTNGLSLPLLIRVDYDKKTWDGKGVNVPFGDLPIRYRSNEKNFQVEAGGGLDKDFGKGTRAAAGLYYNYVNSNRSYFYQYPDQKTDHTDYPHQIEHRGILKIAAEKEFCPSFTARLGLNVFFGWVNEGYKFRESLAPFGGTVEHISIDGPNWGGVLSLGGTVKLSRFNLEPFVSVGYRRLDLDGEDGFRGTFFGSGISLDMDKLKEVWSIGGGLSIKY